MEAAIRTRYNPQLYGEILDRYGITEKQVKLLAGFESFIYEFNKNDAAFILRIGHSMRRSVDLIQGEVEWINFLADGGATVAKAVPSMVGKLVESVADGNGGHFLATCFEKARGAPPKKNDFTPKFIERYGQMLGRIHALSQAYVPSSPKWKRPNWNDPVMLDVQKWLDENNNVVIEKYQKLLKHFEQIPKTQDTYGLIHQDAHYGNFFLDGDGQITLFDFDDCCYSWYINDVAIVLFYAVMGQPDAKAFTMDFLGHFFEGYRREVDVGTTWLQEIPYFLKLREIELYAVIHRSFDVENISDPWVSAFMDGRKQRIEAEIPFIDFDFMKLI